MEQTKKETLLERYWRLRGEADELYQRGMREINRRINEEMRKPVQRELDALEDVIESRPCWGFTSQTDIESPTRIAIPITHAQGVLDIEGVNSLSVSYSSVDERRRTGEEKLE